jgi:carbon storage regulator
MLVLSRKVGEQIQIGPDITVTVLRVDGKRVRLGIAAPSGYRILRSELGDWLKDGDDAPIDPCEAPEEPAGAACVPWVACR